MFQKYVYKSVKNNYFAFYLYQFSIKLPSLNFINFLSFSLSQYINPNYWGAGRGEYFTAEEDAAKRNLDEVDCYGDNCNIEISNLNCQSPNIEWLLLGVYYQELCQFYEQIWKHLWGYQDYEYVAALVGLAYMTDETCSKMMTLSTNTGNFIIMTHLRLMAMV